MRNIKLITRYFAFVIFAVAATSMAPQAFAQQQPEQNGIDTTQNSLPFSIGGKLAMTLNPTELVVNGIANFGGNVAPVVTAQGAYIGWNAVGPMTARNTWLGETDIINNPGLAGMNNSPFAGGGIAFILANSNGTMHPPSMYINYAGNVGINTINPVTALDANAHPVATLDVNGYIHLGATVNNGAECSAPGLVASDDQGHATTCTVTATSSGGTTQLWQGMGKPVAGEAVYVQSNSNTVSSKTKNIHDLCVLQHSAYWGVNQTSVTEGCTVTGSPGTLWTLKANTSQGNNSDCQMQCYDF